MRQKVIKFYITNNYGITGYKLLGINYYITGYKLWHYWVEDILQAII